MTTKENVGKLRINIQLFADGGTGTGAGADGNGVNAGVPDLQTGADLSDMQYGRPMNTAQTETVQESAEDRQARFDQLIKGEFKDLYDKKMQDTVQRRLKNTKETVDRYEALSPTLEMLYGKYGVEMGDVAALNAAIEEDDSYYEDEALEKGVTVKQLKEIKKMERENRLLREEKQRADQQAQVEQDVARWMDEAKQAEKMFPDLDLATELQNPDFLGLLKTGVNLETAYFAVHHRELVPQAMQYAAKTTERQVANKIASQGRPVENGTRNQSPVMSKTDVSSLTSADIAEINRRVARGERISF